MEVAPTNIILVIGNFIFQIDRNSIRVQVGNSNLISGTPYGGRSDEIRDIHKTGWGKYINYQVKEMSDYI